MPSCSWRCVLVEVDEGLIGLRHRMQHFPLQAQATVPAAQIVKTGCLDGHEAAVRRRASARVHKQQLAVAGHRADLSIAPRDVALAVPACATKP